MSGRLGQVGQARRAGIPAPTGRLTRPEVEDRAGRRKRTQTSEGPRVWLCLALSLLLPVSILAEEARPLAEDPAMEQRLARLAQDLRCLVCQNESLAGSRADLAEDLRREIRALMRAGKSDEDVVAFLTARYGDFILYRPPLRAETWLLWFGPLLILMAGGTGLFVYLRRRTAQRAPQVSAEQRRQAEAVLGLQPGGPEQ